MKERFFDLDGWETMVLVWHKFIKSGTNSFEKPKRKSSFGSREKVIFDCTRYVRVKSNTEWVRTIHRLDIIGTI